MTYIQATAQPSPTTIDNFLGLNMNATGDTQLKLGEASRMKNFRITKNYKLTKMDGYKKKYEASGTIRAQWIGKLGDKEVHVYVAGGKIYNKGEEVGELTDDITSIFEFNQKLYFINGHEYKVWDGTELKEVEGYIPLTKTSINPNGIGSNHEPVNLLTDKIKMSFSADGESKEFALFPEDEDMINIALKSIDKVLVNGVETEVTKDIENKKITFPTVPPKGTDNVLVYLSVENDGREKIVKNKYFQKYGLANDTRVFLFGNEDAKNRIVFSDAGDGVPNVEYFPGNNFLDVGSSNMAVTDISRQYNRVIISKETETYFASYEQITDPTGGMIINFPTYPLNSSHGMVAPAQGQLLDNYVTTIDSSIVMWTNTNTKDERNAEVISQRIQEWLNEKDLTKAITMDYQELKEYWLAVENQIMIYNYGNSTFYLLEIPVKITSLISNQGIIYLGTENGKIMEFNEEETTYAGEIIEAIWESGFYDFEIEYKRKTMRALWVALKPWMRTSLVINYKSDRETGTDPKSIQSSCISYRYWNYAKMTYNTSYVVKPYRIKLKAKKFAYEKIILSNKEIDEKVTINSIAIQKSYGGNVK